MADGFGPRLSVGFDNRVDTQEFVYESQSNEGDTADESASVLNAESPEHLEGSMALPLSLGGILPRGDTLRIADRSRTGHLPSVCNPATSNRRASDPGPLGGMSSAELSQTLLRGGAMRAGDRARTMQDAKKVPARSDKQNLTWPFDHKKKARQRARFRSCVMKIMRDCSKIGDTLLFHSYQDYLHSRDSCAKEAYKIEIENNHDFWAKMVDQYRMALLALPSGKNSFDNVYWFGSTAVPGLLAKPVLDLMVVTSLDVGTVVKSICSETADSEWVARHSKGLSFPIGFYMGGSWGFLQMPRYYAAKHGLIECNLHVLPTGSKEARDKLRLANFLKSQEGQEFRETYSTLKVSLERQFESGQLETANYNKEKSSLLTNIMAAAAEWDVDRRETAFSEGRSLRRPATWPSQLEAGG